MMNKVKNICTVLAPNLFIFLYAICMEMAEDYAGRSYETNYVFMVKILGGVILGILLFFVCKDGFDGSRPRSLIKYIIGILIIPLIFVITILFYTGYSIVFVWIVYYVNFYFIFASVYAALFVYSLAQRKKAAGR